MKDKRDQDMVLMSRLNKERSLLIGRVNQIDKELEEIMDKMKKKSELKKEELTNPEQAELNELIKKMPKKLNIN